MDGDLKKWLCERPAWLIEAAKRLLAGELTEKDINELTGLCCIGASPKYTVLTTSFASCSLSSQPPGVDLTRLVAISGIQGINALKPRKPLEFGSNNLVVIYGVNGSGKSGYVRLLKKISGCVNQSSRILPDVFSSKPKQQTCQIAILVKDKRVDLSWVAADSFLDELRGLNIYDTDCGQVYINKDNELSFEPPVLRFLSKMVEVCDMVSKNIQGKIDCEIKALPQFPVEYAGTSWAKWIQQLSHSTSCKELKQLRWTKIDEDSSVALHRRLLEEAPADKAQKMDEKKKAVDAITTVLENANAVFSAEALQNIKQLRNKADQAVELAEVYAQSLFNEAVLQGIGNECWKQLWECARKYSEEQAYPQEKYPVISEGALCVLCQQPLSAEAKRRMAGFEAFVKGELQQAADHAVTAHRKALEALELKISSETVAAQGVVAELNQEEIRFLEEYIQAITKLTKEMKSACVDVPDLLLPDNSTIVKDLNELSRACLELADKYRQDALIDNRASLAMQKKELDAKKWLFQQRRALVIEIRRLRRINKYQIAQNSTNTMAITKKKSELAEQCITEAYIKRFNDELNRLGGKPIPIAIDKVKGAKGKILHGIRLKGANAGSPGEVLSEGEFRIISLAAFLADMLGKDGAVPFVFDDPISSLDQGFEEKVAKRLTEISQERQVIVFTHRLSLVSSLEEWAEKMNIKWTVKGIFRQPWGAGEPGDLLLKATQIEGAINDLKNARLSKAKKTLESEGNEAYEPLAQGMCSDYRILLERVIEEKLLCGVVARFRRKVKTQGIISGLANISATDCQFFDGMMTKYSCYEHSQPQEAPIEVIQPDELLLDIDELIKWNEAFKLRSKVKT